MDLCLKSKAHPTARVKKTLPCTSPEFADGISETHLSGSCRAREEANLGEEASSHSSPKALIQSPLRKGQCYSKDNCSAESFTAA